MSFRALALGLLLALFISVATYFNDWIIGQTQLIGNFLPISVFGLAAFVLLVVNPALRAFGERAPLRGGEVALITALGLVACGWPGSNFYRTFTHVAALPSHWLKTKANWQSANVMSYVPGASAELGQGHVRDWKAFARALGDAEAKGQVALAAVWSALGPEAQRAFREAARAGADAVKVSDLVPALNEALRKPELYRPEAFRGLEKPPELEEILARPAKSLAAHEVTLRNRLLLVAAAPAMVLPPPEGQGVLFDGGRADPFAVDTLLQGRAESKRLGISELPWSKWWPTLKLWVGAALAFAMASLCMALIVHPQWSKRELLPYPIARFIEEAAERKPGSLLPEIARSKLFWLGAGALAFLHLVNGLHAWFDWVPEIPRNYDFWPLQTLFPNAVRVWGQWGYFGPTFYVSVIAFSFFMSTSVSFSLGMAQILYMAFGAFLLTHGIQLEASGIEGKASNLLRFGGYLAVALVIAYTGRRYYANVVKSAFGAAREKDTPGYATWAARGFMLSVVLAVAIVKSAGLSWWVAAGFVALELVLILVMTRIVTETGSFFMQASWTPVGVLTALFGFEAIGPTTYIVLCIATVMLFIDSRELLMPYVANALKLGDRHDGAPPRRLWPWFGGVIVAGAALAGAVTLYLQYNHSLTQKGNDWATNYLPTFAFDALAQAVSKASAEGTLSSATALSGFASLGAFRPEPAAFTWVFSGLGFALVAAVARLRLPWWPLHPVAFLVWGTYPIVMFGPSFLIGWLVKAAVIGTTGAKGYHTFRPLMVGVIAGELLMGLIWMIVGVVYYFAAGKAPVMYNIFPG